MAKRDKLEIGTWILNQLSIGKIQTCGFSVEYFASYQYNVWFLYAKVPGHSVTNQKEKNNFTIDSSTIWSLLSLHTFFNICHRSFWYVFILNILFQERRATSLSGVPTGSILVVFIPVIVVILYTGKISPPFYFRPFCTLAWGRI